MATNIPVFPQGSNALVLRSAEVGGLYVNEYLQTQPTPWHRHEEFNLALILDGTGLSATTRDEFTYSRGQVVFESRDIPQRHDCRSLHCLNIHFAPRVIEDYGRIPPALLAMQCFDGGSPTALMHRMYDELRQGDAASKIALHGLALELIAELMRPKFLDAERSAPAWLRRIRDYLRENFAEPLSLTELATDAGVHPAHLSRAFHKFAGCTIGQFVRKLRVERAVELIATTELPLSTISVMAGFYDQADMTRLVKRWTGRTPAKYRNSPLPR